MNVESSVLLTAVAVILLGCPQFLFAETFQIQVETLDHQTIEYTPSKLRLTEKALTFDSPVKTAIPLAELIVIRIQTSKSKSKKIVRFSESGIRLVNDDWLNLVPEKIERDRLQGMWVNRTVSVPLSNLRYFSTHRSAGEEQFWKLFNQLELTRPGSDILFDSDGNQMKGTFRSMDATKVAYDVGGRELQISRNRVRAVSIDPDLTFMVKTKGLRFLCLFTDGSQITGKQLQIVDNQITLEAEFGSTLTVPVESLSEIRILESRAVYLSDLQPHKTTMQPFFTVKREWRKDRNILGRPMHVDEKSVVKGIGMTGHTELEYSLERKFQSFSASLAIDDAAKKKGHATFTVFVDDRQVQAGEISGMMKPVKIGPHNLENARTLMLAVGFGQRGDVLDYVNWCHPILVKMPEDAESSVILPTPRGTD